VETVGSAADVICGRTVRAVDCMYSEVHSFCPNVLGSSIKITQVFRIVHITQPRAIFGSDRMTFSWMLCCAHS
jgi:hypothetical protein